MKARKIKFVAACDEQVRWGGCDDPRGVLAVGEVYEVDTVETHSWHTKVSLVGVHGAFNSVHFEDVE
jgi:hypothetical protein